MAWPRAGRLVRPARSGGDAPAPQVPPTKWKSPAFRVRLPAWVPAAGLCGAPHCTPPCPVHVGDRGPRGGSGPVGTYGRAAPPSLVSYGLTEGIGRESLYTSIILVRVRGGEGVPQNVMLAPKQKLSQQHSPTGQHGVGYRTPKKKREHSNGNLEMLAGATGGGGRA